MFEWFIRSYCSSDINSHLYLLFSFPSYHFRLSKLHTFYISSRCTFIRYLIVRRMSFNPSHSIAVADAGKFSRVSRFGPENALAWVPHCVPRGVEYWWWEIFEIWNFSYEILKIFFIFPILPIAYKISEFRFSDRINYMKVESVPKLFSFVDDHFWEYFAKNQLKNWNFSRIIEKFSLFLGWGLGK